MDLKKTTNIQAYSISFSVALSIYVFHKGHKGHKASWGFVFPDFFGLHSCKLT